MKLLVLAMVVGGVVGVELGRRDGPPAPREEWLAEARAALTGDAQSQDIERALHTLDRVLERDPSPEARELRYQLVRQQSCRRAFDTGEHHLALGNRAWARAAFEAVGTRCQLYTLAQAELQALQQPPRLEQIGRW